MALTPIAWGKRARRRATVVESRAGRTGMSYVPWGGASERWLVVPCGEGEQLALASGFRRRRRAWSWRRRGSRPGRVLAHGKARAKAAEAPAWTPSGGDFMQRFMFPLLYERGLHGLPGLLHSSIRVPAHFDR